MAYTTKAKLEAYIGKTLTSGQNTLFDSWVLAAKNYIENYTGRKFEQEAGATRYFDGNGGNEIIIDDFTAITSLTVLEVDGTTLQLLVEGDDQDFVTYPYNDTIKYKIILQASSAIGYFPKRHKSVKVVATWNAGTTVPADIELVANMLISGIIASANANGKDVSSESLGDYSISFNNNSNISEDVAGMGVKQILDQYIIYEL